MKKRKKPFLFRTFQRISSEEMRSFTLILCFSSCCRGNYIYNDDEAPQPLLERKRGVWRATLDELRSGEAMLLEKYEVTLLATEKGQEEVVARRRLGGKYLGGGVEKVRRL